MGAAAFLLRGDGPTEPPAGKTPRWPRAASRIQQLGRPIPAIWHHIWHGAARIARKIGPFGHIHGLAGETRAIGLALRWLRPRLAPSVFQEPPVTPAGPNPRRRDGGASRR